MNKAHSSYHLLALSALLPALFSCGLGRKTKYHCDTRSLRRFELETKTIDGTTATLLLKGKQGQKIEAKDGLSDADCRDAGVQVQPLTLAPGLKMRAYICHKPATGEFHWTEIDAQSEVDQLIVSDGDWLILDELHYAENAATGRSGMPGSIVRMDPATRSIYTTALPSDLDSYGTCGSQLKQLTARTFYSMAMVPLDIQ